MNSRPSLTERIQLFARLVNESPYISREQRLGIIKEIDHLAIQVAEGRVGFPQGEKSLGSLDKRAAADEIYTLACKIRHLNPSSPRLGSLKSLEHELQADQISPEQARRKLQTLMGV